jgi:nucleotide-binding universal stress UspA family protein
MIKSILVPVDGSAHANAAVDMAGELAAKVGAKVILLNVIARPGSSLMPEELRGYAQLEHVRITEHDLLQAAANEIVAKAEKRARAKGAAKVESATRVGDPARTIVAIAKDRNVDLIAMGRRGLGDLKGLLLGSVSHKVSQLADRPCMTVS